MNDLNKLNYKELSDIFESIDYQKFIKALFYYEKKDSLVNFNEKECDEVLNNCYEFFMESVDGTFLNENINENFYKLLDNYSNIDEEIEVNKNFKEKEEQENLNNLFEQDSLGNFVYIEQKQNDILKDISREQEIINNLKKAILQFDNFHPLQKCNFGTMTPHMQTSCQKLSENLKLYINHPYLKVMLDYNQFSVIKYKEGSGKVLAEDLKLKLEIIDESKTFNFKFEIPYDTISFEKDENGYIIYNPSQIKINEDVLENILKQKIFEHIKKFLGEKNETNIEYDKHSRELLSGSKKSNNELLQKNANNISLSMEPNVSFEYENSRICSSQKTSQKMEQNRLSEIAISPILSNNLQNLSRIRAKAERNFIINEELDFFQKKLANTLLELNITNNTEEKLSKALSIYEAFGENFTKKDLNTKLNDKLENKSNFNSSEKDKIINDYILAIGSNNHHLIKKNNLDKLIEIVDEKLQDLKNNKNDEAILILEENINNIKNYIRKVND
ncbi:hypothetical protein ABZK66_001885 [Campylobacter coli]|nr:hypothetical protein [Campylobacter coli]EAL9963444.1 hypothetical protein [Campylobacter coli]EFQ8267487.1 hypothetical protein [Campylobacter coli]EKH9412772.1 hypothetical protein [Campylobacter coli]